jgi:GT2 family glycosyltransferase
VTTDILYLTHGRLEFTEASLATLVFHTDWTKVNEFVVYNDSTPEKDGATDTLVRKLAGHLPQVQFRNTNLHSPVGVMSHFLARTSADRFAKIDNDVIVPDGWLNALTQIMDDHPEVELLGTEIGYGGSPLPDWDGRFGVVRSSHIGGIGLMNVGAFRNRVPFIANGRFGFTEWQHQQEVGAYWVTPDMPIFLLDRIPVEPWASLSARYAEEGVSRRDWEKLDPRDANCWEWWTGAHE